MFTNNLDIKFQLHKYIQVENIHLCNNAVLINQSELSYIYNNS